MIKILHILTDTNIGGAGRLLVNYLHNFDRTMFDITVALPEGSDLIPCVTAEGYPVIGMRYGHDKSFEFPAVRELKSIIKDLKPDIVHAHSALSGRIAAYLCRVPARFYTRHCAFEPPKWLTTFPGKQISGFVNNTLATDIVAVAEAAKKNMTDTGVDERKITVIINGVEPMRKTSDDEKRALKISLGIPEDTFVCVISARLEDYKGHSYLLDTIKEVSEKHPDIVCLVIGGGSLDETLKKRAGELEIAGKVRFTGFVNDVAPYYNIMDLNLNCSWGTETSSLALSEGFSLGVPAVATTFGGNPYMVTDGENGILVPERDSHAMAEAILRLINSPETMKRMSGRAYELYCEKFTASAMTRQLEKLYINAAERKR